jgi:hypothetical protein
MNYRTKPFDFTNTKDVIEAATYITAEYVDMSCYWGNLSEIASAFDESLEVFDPAAWMGISEEVRPTTKI